MWNEIGGNKISKSTGKKKEVAKKEVEVKIVEQPKEKKL